MTTTIEMTGATLAGAEIGGRVVPWADLLAAATQDRMSHTEDHRGCPVPPDPASAPLAETYRDLLRRGLPMLQEREQAVYETYCGSWVSGPSAKLQGAAWRGWQSLVARVEAAIA